MRYAGLPLALALALAGLLACAGGTQNPAAAGDYRLIVQMTDAALDPSEPALLQALSTRFGAELDYLRPLTGQAHLLRVQGLADGERIESMLQDLRGSALVRTAELDARRQVQE